MKSNTIMRLVLLLSILVTFGCAGSDMAIRQEAMIDNYKHACNSWLNHDINELVRSWGPSSNSYDMPNGNKIYTWVKGYTTRQPVMTFPSTTTYNVYGNTVYQNNPMAMTIGGNEVTYYCETSFEVNTAGTIVFYRFQGNYCLAK